MSGLKVYSVEVDYREDLGERMVFEGDVCIFGDSTDDHKEFTVLATSISEVESFFPEGVIRSVECSSVPIVLRGVQKEF